MEDDRKLKITKTMNIIISYDEHHNDVTIIKQEIIPGGLFTLSVDDEMIRTYDESMLIAFHDFVIRKRVAKRIFDELLNQRKL